MMATRAINKPGFADGLMLLKLTGGTQPAFTVIISIKGNCFNSYEVANSENINGVKFDGSGDININTLVSRK